MKNNQGIIDLRAAIKSVSDSSVRQDKGPGIFDTATIDESFQMTLPGIDTKLKPNQYFVLTSLLSEECETEWRGAGIEEIKVKEKSRFTPGEYLIIYLGAYPVAISKMVKGDKANAE